MGIAVAPSFARKADAYVARFFAKSATRDHLIIEAYLSQAALRIARNEGKTRLEGEDFKAAIWLFHLPMDPDEACLEAGTHALAYERERAAAHDGILMVSFASHLNRSLGKIRGTHYNS